MVSFYGDVEADFGSDEPFTYDQVVRLGVASERRSSEKARTGAQIHLESQNSRSYQ